VFEAQTTDVAPFQLAFLELTAKSTNCKVKTNQLDLRRFQLIRGVSAASRVVVPSSLAASSLLHHSIMQAHHVAATHVGLTSAQVEAAAAATSDAKQQEPADDNAEPQCPENSEENNEGAVVVAQSKGSPPVLPEALCQDWIKESFSPTLSLVRIVPTSGTFVVGPDDVLRFHSDGPLIDLPCSTLVVHYDPRQYPSSAANTEGVAASSADAPPGEAPHAPWTIKLFNVGVLAGAVELLIAVDTYRGGRDDAVQREPSLNAFARFDCRVLAALMLRTRPVPTIPASVVSTFQSQVHDGGICVGVHMRSCK
jgi:hypothetical protein